MFEIDKYTIKARLYPSFIVLIPLLALSIYYITNLEKYYHYFTALMSAGIFTFLLSQIGRDNGKIKEHTLYSYFGGKPSTQILRHRDTYIDSVTKERYHKLLENKIEDLKIPTKEEETFDAYYADQVYASCATFLISKTRDTKKFSLLFKENISYGFRRNLWGMKGWALFILLIVTVFHFYLITRGFAYFNNIAVKDIGLFVFFSVIGIFWLFIVNKNWVKIPAFGYAERLYETLNEL